MNIVITDKVLGVKEIEGLIISGENNANIIDIEFPKTYENVDLSDKTFVIKCINQNGIYFETILPKKIEAEKIILTWNVSKEFTSVAGTLKVAVFTEDSEDYILGTKTSKIMVASSPSITVPIDQFTVFEKYLKEMRVLTDVAVIASKDSQNILAEMNSKIVDNLTTDSSNKALAAKQGKVLNERINNIVGQAGTSNTEIVDARYSSVSGTTYSNLSARIADTEKEIEKGLFSDTQSATQPIISLPSTAVKGKLDGSLKGNTLYQAVVNGDFANGTVGWSAVSATITTNAKTLVVTANGTGVGGYVNKNIPFGANLKYFVKTKARVTNSDCLSIRIGTNLGVVALASSPLASQWYDVFGVFLATTDSEIRITEQYPDVATANGKVMEIDGNTGVFAIPITGTPYENWTANQINAMIDGYWEGLGGTQPSRVKSVGKNLFDGKNSIPNKRFSTVTGDIESNSGGVTFLNYIKVKPSAQYSRGAVSVPNNRIIEYDRDKKIIGYVSLTSGAPAVTFTTASNAHYLRLSFAGGNNDIMLNEGSTALPYEPYEETSLYCPVPLNSVLNGIKDEFYMDGKNLKRVQNGTIKAIDLISAVTTGTTIESMKTATTFLSDANKTGWMNSAVVKSVVVSGWNEKIYADSLDSIGTFCTNADGSLSFMFAKGTTLEQAKTALTNVQIIYQLATPIETQYNVSALQSNPSGSIYIENVTKVNKVYGLGISVTSPIKTIESVIKINGDVRTPIDLSLVTVSGDKLSLTILNASPKDFYEIVYLTNGKTLGTLDYKYPMNISAEVQNNTTGVMLASKMLNDFIAYQNTVNLQFDFRLVTGGH